MNENYKVYNIEKGIKGRTPLISVIGATFPSLDYNDEGIEIGYKLRKMLKGRKGTIFTGGVPGVGLDVYQGVINFCKETGSKRDRFFILYPAIYGVPSEYLACPGKSVDIKLVDGGIGMDERRINLANISDVSVVVNGSFGTLDEAVRILRQHKKLYVLTSSGGVAKKLGQFKHPNIISHRRVDELVSDLERNLYRIDPSKEI